MPTLFVALIAAGLGLALGLWLGARARATLAAERAALVAQLAEHTASLGAAHRAMHQGSETDLLTGLRNRRFLEAKLPADLANLQRAMRDGRDGGRSVGLLVVDVDAFHLVNERFGHEAGDDALRGLATVLEGALREGDYAVRWGADSFLLVLREMAHGRAATVAAKVRARIAAAALPVVGPRPLRLTASIGAIEYPVLRGAPEALDWQVHVALAERALAAARQAGKDAIREMVPADDADARLAGRGVPNDADALLADGLLQIATRAAR
jgi:diguanylate cyclase (GGDEF)-like protein